jgi:hypothetical protein
MQYLKKAFLYVVGAAAVAIEESTKVIKDQQKKLNKTLRRAKA